MEMLSRGIVIAVVLGTLATVRAADTVALDGKGAESISLLFARPDSVTFTYERSFHARVMVQAYHFSEGPAVGFWIRWEIGPRVKLKEGKKKISEEDFRDLCDRVLDSRLIEASRTKTPDEGLDGSSWRLRANKGDLNIEHYRWSPVHRTSDSAIVAAGKRFLELAGIEIPAKEMY